ncbi:MAG: Peptide-methionine (S)-S-oxide reductase MsrA, partial [uncultured Solirubrobacteraceae bacterium]
VLRPHQAVPADAGGRAAGPRHRDPRAVLALRARHAAEAPVPRPPRADRGRDGLLLGRRAHLLAGARRLHHRGRLRRRRDQEPHLRGDLLGPHRPHRGRARRLRSRDDLPRRDPADVLGGPQPDPGHAPGQRRRDPVPLGRLRLLTRAARGGRAHPRRVRREAARGRPRRHHDGGRRGRSVLLRRGVPPAVPRQEPQRVLRDRRHRRELPDRRQHV